MNRARAALAMIVACAAPLRAQQDVAQRLRRAAPEVVRVVDSAVALAVTRGLPGEPLVQKAIEGTAKGAPPERIGAAVLALLDRLEAAAAALRAGGHPAPHAAAIEAGAFALSAGLEPTAVAALARGRGGEAVDVTLRVSGTLRAMGVPAAQVVELVNQALRADQPPGRLLALPGQVQAAIARGATPAAAAAGVARAGQRRANPPPPPNRGPPPDRGPPARP